VPIGVRVITDAVGRHPATVEEAVFYCAREAIQNATKHVGASATVTLSLKHDDKGIEVEVADDGPGFDPRQQSSGFGLAKRTNQAIARAERVTAQTVGKWRQRFVERRLDGLVDEPRPGQPRKITDEQVEEVIIKTLEEAPPDGGTHWSTRQMAAATGLNQTAVSRIWRAFALQPHRVEH